MAEGETEKEYDTRKAIELLRERFQELTTTLKESPNSPLDASLHFCQEFCQVLVEHASRWKTDEDPLPLLEVYTQAILSYAKATPCLSSECENVPHVLEKLALSCVELLLSLSQHVPGALWEEFQSSVKMAHSFLQESGNMQLHMLSALAQEHGVWSNTTLTSILSNEMPEMERVHEFLDLEGPTLLTMRIKHLMKDNHAEKAAILAKVCSEYPGYEGKGNFKQTYLVCMCMTKTQEQLMEEMAQVDCKDALEMICNLESEGEENAALCLCSVFLKRQLLLGEVYCAWELTLFWSKLVMRVESSTEAFLAQCRKMALLSRSVCHILFLIKVIQSEVEGTGLPTCIEMCIQALQMTSNDNTDSKATICKTISCLLPADLEVKRACQLTEFLLHPTVDSYYAVESLYNEPDQKLEEEDNLPVPNSLRCELLLALKTQWPFDPEFWDWRTLKRNCLSLMGDEASIVSSIDTLNDTDDYEPPEAAEKGPEFTDLEDFLTNATNELNEIADEKEKNREAKKLREQGFVSARFRNWRAYMQYCVLCDKEFLGHRIVRHAQKHFKDGVYMCPICADSFETREVLDPHVASHVKQSCKQRLAAMKTQNASKIVRKPPQSPGSQSKSFKDTVVKVEAQASDGIHTSAISSVQVSPLKPGQPKCEQELTDDCSCPVTNCHKVFKFFRHLMCHVRAHKDDEEATHFLELQKQKVVCQYCRRHFVNVKHLNDHLQMHCGTRPYFCIQLNCTANFNSNSELLMHKRLHTEFKAQCMFPNCGRVFGEAHLLYDHEAQHYLTYTCRMANCGKNFDSQDQFQSHQHTHGPNDPPVTSENHLATKEEPSPQHTPKKEERCSVFVRLERINTQDYMRDGGLKSPTSASPPPQVPKEMGPVRVKHSVESMLNSVMSPTTEPEKCYTPLTPPPALQSGSSNPAPPVPQPIAANGENPMYPCTDNPVEGPLNEPPGNGVPSQKALPQIFPTPQIKLENPFSMLGYPTTPSVASSEENAHGCPYEGCTRSYSTNKSLSRHVKKIHPEIFEEWKLAKKYNKVVKITAKKISSKASDVKSPSHDDGSQHHLSPLCNNTGLQMEYPMVCSSSPAPCYPVSVEPVPITPMINHSMYPQWGNPQNPTGLIQADMSAWSPSAMNSSYADAYHMNEYPSRSLAHWQSDTYHTPTGHPPERDKEHPVAAIHGGTIPHVTSEPSLMNEMSQYVSSSLMLDNGLQMHNGGHQYGMVHTDSVEAPPMRKSSVIMAGHSGQLGNVSTSTVESMPGGSYNPSYVSNVSSCLSPRPPMEIPTKGMGHDGQLTPQGAVDINRESMTPSYPLQMDSSADGMASPTAHADLPYEEDAESEAAPSDDKSGIDTEMHKGKRSRQSKRTKWPAIIKDGKVICRRCFREFSSTKSLGGHLSKRSQCKPLDEIDLTADLPTSFLDFLNDPHVPDTNGAMYNMSNGDFPQEGGNAPKPGEMAQQEGQDSNPSSSGHPNHTAAQSKSNTASTPGHPEANLMDIQNAFQRLDLVEAAREKMLGKIASEQTAGHCDAVLDRDQSVPQIKIKKEEPTREKGPKPFKCEQDTCDYGFMTKEALFRHLSRMHDYSNEMIEELKKTPVKLAPYPCQICPKTFTRTTGLRIHYENVHRLSKDDMAKMNVGCRKKRSSISSPDTEPDASSHGMGTSFGSVVIKQEPLDVAIGGLMEGMDQEGSTMAPEDTITGNTGEQGPTHQITVERVQQPENNPMNSERSSSEFVSPYKTGHALAERTDPAPQADRSPKVEPKLLTLKAKEAHSDTTLGQAVEAMSSPPDRKFSPEKPGSSKSTPSKDESPVQKREKLKKRVGLKMCEMDGSFSPYRPYRCVHEGCVAAFTIQQNLILHYRAMHQSSLPQADPGAGKAGVTAGQDAEVNGSEVRCQVKDCSRIFQGITRLIQHYLLLHKFTRDKATAMVSSMKVGTFQCDMSQCTLSFNSVDKYIEHIKNFHKEIKISESGTVDQTFKCEHEGCDCVYTTRSNLLRHLMKKHDFVCDTKTQQVKTAAVSPNNNNNNNGKENIEKFKLKKKNKKKDGKTLEHWTSFGKPTLKSHEEASAMCTKKSSLQYPCMIKGCDAVERAERNIFRHYTTHGLTERYIEDQRSQFIFCKKLSRARFKDSNKSEGMSTSSSSVETDHDESEAESSKVSSQIQEPLEPVIKEEAKLSNDESSESINSTGEERKKRGRPRKADQKAAVPVKKSTLRTRSTVMAENSDSGTATSLEEQSADGEPFQPLGFENSFLQFLETTESPNIPKRKLAEGPTTELPPKRQRTLQQKTANIMSKIPDEIKGCQNLVDFRNPLNLKSAKNVKIVMDRAFSDRAELLLKQLQVMRPMVIIKKCLYS